MGGGKRATNKMYLKSRLNCVLMGENFDPDKVEVKDDEEQPKTELKNEEDSDDDIEIIDDDDEDSGVVDNSKEEGVEDALWDNMIVIDSKRKKGDDKVARKKL